MPAPPAIPLDPTMATDFHVASETPTVISYKLWVLRAGDRWYAIGPEKTNDERSDHWIFTPPMPAGSELAYWLGAWGHANAAWRVRVTVSQKDAAGADAEWIRRGSWTESGVLTDEGNGGGLGTIPAIPRVRLGP